MEIHFHKTGKRFNNDWIFRNMELRLQAGESYAVLGPNGSGKSTFLQVAGGSLIPSEGSIFYSVAGKPIPPTEIFRHFSISAPYLELIEEFTLSEIIDFHFRFKKLLPGASKKLLLDTLSFSRSIDKPVKYFSSGMKQRLKLVLAVFSDAPLLLLDEPVTNLDSQGVSWYQQLIAAYAQNRLMIICSNQEKEVDFCTRRIYIEEYKGK